MSPGSIYFQQPRAPSAPPTATPSTQPICTALPHTRTKANPPATLCSICSSDSTGRSVLRPEGSPTRPVAPPSSATGSWPHLDALEVWDRCARQHFTQCVKRSRCACTMHIEVPIYAWCRSRGRTAGVATARCACSLIGAAVVQGVHGALGDLSASQLLVPTCRCHALFYCRGDTPVHAHRWNHKQHHDA